MHIELPDHLYKFFLQFLDIAQAFYTQEDVDKMHPNEKALIKWVEDLLGDDRCKRFASKEAMDKANQQIARQITNLLDNANKKTENKEESS
jgi:hypothetical protein